MPKIIFVRVSLSAYDRKGTCDIAAREMIHKSVSTWSQRQWREPQFLVHSPMSEPVAQGHSTWVGLQDHRKVSPKINSRVEAKMTEGEPSGMLIYQGFTCWLMIAITVCLWQTLLDMCSEKLYLKLDYTGSIQFPFLLLGLSSQSLALKFALLFLKERQLFL